MTVISYFLRCSSRSREVRVAGENRPGTCCGTQGPELLNWRCVQSTPLPTLLSAAVDCQVCKVVWHGALSSAVVICAAHVCTRSQGLLT
mmetsp:Transcript_19359/g.34283  ORF Transcript_19359/g.34283 Transcript_19359/m.34283 type:complete len:89 (-) Transcript_19359:555-821(-)